MLGLFSTSPTLAEPFRLGPIYTDQPGEVSVVVEFEAPPGPLPSSYFRLVEDGKPIATAREIKSFKDSGQGLALIICVDVSGSMKGAPLADTQEALLSFLGKVRSQDHIALVSFADEDKIESSFTDTREQLAQAIRNLQPRGTQTKLRQTLYKALDMFDRAKVPERRRLLVISDGRDEGSVESIRNVIDKATKSSFTPIDVVGRGKIAPQFTEVLQSLAGATGGRFAHARPNRLTLTDAIDWIYSSLSETPSLVVYFSYEKGTAGRKMRDASIELQRPGQEQPSSERLLEEIPWSVEKPPTSIVEQPPLVEQPSKWSKWLGVLFWLLFILLLVMSLAVLIRRRSQKADVIVRPPLTLPPSPPTLEPSISSSVQETFTNFSDPGRPIARARDATVVGRYIFPLPKPGNPTAILNAVGGPLDGKQFAIEKESFHIGVSPDNDLCIAQDDYASEKHAHLHYEKGSLRIYDKGSKNGTFVNQNEVPESGLVLSIHDRIREGMSIFEVVGAQR
jgi:Mg-chelatase subunit ChlD